MKVTFKQQVFSPLHGQFEPDKVYEVPDDFAKSMITAKYANEAPKDSRAVNVAAVEQPDAAANDSNTTEGQ